MFSGFLAPAGEILALRWSDIDFGANQVSVSRSLELTKNGLNFKTPKTAKSRRRIALPQVTARMLSAYKVSQAAEKLRLGPAYQDNDLVFARRDGTAWRPDSEVYFELAVTYHRAEQWGDAFDVLEQGRSAVEDDECLSYQIGRTAALSGEGLERGAAEMTRFITHWAHYCVRTDYSTTAFWRLGMIYEHMGKLEDARVAFQRALEIDPRHKDSKRALKLVRMEFRRQ